MNLTKENAFYLIKNEDKKSTYATNNLYEKIRNRKELEKFLLPIAKDFMTYFNNKAKLLRIDFLIEHDNCGNFTGFNSYKVSYKDKIICYELFRLSKGFRWRKRYNCFKINLVVNILD